jgi:hypothetical protein
MSEDMPPERRALLRLLSMHRLNFLAMPASVGKDERAGQPSEWWKRRVSFQHRCLLVFFLLFGAIDGEFRLEREDEVRSRPHESTERSYFDRIRRWLLDFGTGPEAQTNSGLPDIREDEQPFQFWPVNKVSVRIRDSA